jgi:hypothetical protein
MRATDFDPIAGSRFVMRPIVDSHDRGTRTDPSYVQSILFGRRWMRGSIPVPRARAGAARHGKPRRAREQERN